MQYLVPTGAGTSQEGMPAMRASPSIQDLIFEASQSCMEVRLWALMRSYQRKGRSIKEARLVENGPSVSQL